jgi:hypothetical protein
MKSVLRLCYGGLQYDMNAITLALRQKIFFKKKFRSFAKCQTSGTWQSFFFKKNSLLSALQEALDKDF